MNLNKRLIKENFFDLESYNKLNNNTIPRSGEGIGLRDNTEFDNTKEECAALCDETPDCNAFSHRTDYQTNRCYLKKKLRTN